MAVPFDGVEVQRTSPTQANSVFEIRHFTQHRDKPSRQSHE